METANVWPLVPLGDVLTERQEVPPDMALLTGKIPIVGKISFNDGIISLRDEGTTKTRMILIRPGDLVLSGINAAKGAIAVYGEENTKSIAATIHYGAYIPDRERVDVKFLWWLLRSSTFRVLLRQYLPGGIKTELKAKRLLPIPVPLPPLEEQRRIVARIEELAAKVGAARALREEAVKEAESLCRAIIFDPRIHTELTPMKELVTLKKPDVSVELDETYHFAGVYCFGKGVFRSIIKTGAEFSYRRLTKLSTDNFVYPKLMAWEGALGVVPPKCDGCVVSPEFPVFEVKEDKVLPETLDVYFRTPQIWELVAGISTGTNVRRRRLHPKNEVLTRQLLLGDLFHAS